MKITNSVGFQRAVERICAQGEPEDCWALLAESSPALFLGEVGDRIARLRAEREADVKTMRDALDVLSGLLNAKPQWCLSTDTCPSCGCTMLVGSDGSSSLCHSCCLLSAAAALRERIEGEA